jgi:cytochrome c-type biogenesis protein CcmH
VLDFMVQRYGEFVLLRPRFSWRTALLWLAPLVLLIGGGLILFMLARRRGQGVPADSVVPQGGALTADEERRLAGLIKPEDR